MYLVEDLIGGGNHIVVYFSKIKLLKVLAEFSGYGDDDENMYYHGSNAYDLDYFKPSDEGTHLLGYGVYFYKNKSSAKQYGSHIYAIELNPDWNIAPKNFQFNESEIRHLLKDLDLDASVDLRKSPAGLVKPIWWATEAPFYFKVSRRLVADLLSEMMGNKFDGMLTDYPNGGEVLVLWHKYDDLVPNKISN